MTASLQGAAPGAIRLVVLGAGAWGTALAISASQLAHNSVTLWARDEAQAAQIQAQRQNTRYLPGVALPEALKIATGNLRDLIHAAQPQLIIIATPLAALRECLSQLAMLPHGAAISWLCKGFENASDQAHFGLLGHEIHAQVAKQAPAQSSSQPSPGFGVLSGPSFALEVARGQPTALVASSSYRLVNELLIRAFHSPSLRVYANNDMIGVEVGGAVKNVLALATGLCDGLQLGLNARAALITRGLSEMTRLGLALGAQAETFMGLSGLGDLVLTATGDLSRNRKVGLLLAQGMSLAQAVDSLGHIAEGVYCARTVIQRARHLQLEMPICEAVVGVLEGRLTAAQGVAELMSRDPSSEKTKAV